MRRRRKVSIRLALWVALLVLLGSAQPVVAVSQTLPCDTEPVSCTMPCCDPADHPCQDCQLSPSDWTAPPPAIVAHIDFSIDLPVRAICAVPIEPLLPRPVLGRSLSAVRPGNGPPPDLGRGPPVRV